jgi:hypothetical protein
MAEFLRVAEQVAVVRPQVLAAVDLELGVQLVLMAVQMELTVIFLDLVELDQLAQVEWMVARVIAAVAVDLVDLAQI